MDGSEIYVEAPPQIVEAIGNVNANSAQATHDEDDPRAYSEGLNLIADGLMWYLLSSWIITCSIGGMSVSSYRQECSE